MTWQMCAQSPGWAHGHQGVVEHPVGGDTGASVGQCPSGPGVAFLVLEHVDPGKVWS